MRSEQIEKLTPQEFKRLCGVSLETFAMMVKVVKQIQLQKKVAGRPGKLSVKNQVLMTLTYLRESGLGSA